MVEPKSFDELMKMLYLGGSEHQRIHDQLEALGVIDPNDSEPEIEKSDVEFHAHDVAENAVNIVSYLNSDICKWDEKHPPKGYRYWIIIPVFNEDTHLYNQNVLLRKPVNGDWECVVNCGYIFDAIDHPNWHGEREESATFPSAKNIKQAKKEAVEWICQNIVPRNLLYMG